MFKQKGEYFEGGTKQRAKSADFCRPPDVPWQQIKFLILNLKGKLDINNTICCYASKQLWPLWNSYKRITAFSPKGKFTQIDLVCEMEKGEAIVLLQIV